MNPTTSAPVNPMFAKFDQALGVTTPTTPHGAPQTRSDEILALGKSVGGEQEGGLASKIGSDFAARGERILDSADKTRESIKGAGGGLGANLAGIGQTMGNLAGETAGGVINAGLEAGKALVNKINGDNGETLARGGEEAMNAKNILGETNRETLAKVGSFVKNGLDALPPEVVQSFGNFLNTIGLMGGGKVADMPVGDAVTGVKNAVTGTKDALVGAKDTVSDAASAVKSKIAPSATSEELTGKVLQGKTKDIASGKSGLASLDTSKVKTYADLNKTASGKIKELVTKQDELLSKDTTPRELASFEKTTGEGENAVKTNYVSQAIDNLKELYGSTNDAEGLAGIKAIETKANAEGLTVKEVNDLAREYGADFGSKAFGKTGEPLTSVNAQRYENTRIGVKDTARDLLPDDESKALDRQMTDIYTVRDLSGKMAERVNTAVQRLQNPNILQKLAGVLGKSMKITGVGDFLSKLLGMDKLPGVSKLDPVDLENQLSKNLGKLNAALAKDDAGFVKAIKDMAEHPPNETPPKSGQTPQKPVKSSSDKPTTDLPNKQGGFIKNPFAKQPTPEEVAQNMSAGDVKLVNEYLTKNDLDTYNKARPAIEAMGIGDLTEKELKQFLTEARDLYQK